MREMQAPSRSERRKARTTAAILDAAERHFLERGFQAAKVDEIADEADVAVGSVYNHFANKEGLYAALLERALDLFDAYMEEEPEADGPALEQLLDTAGRVARFGRERPGHMRLLVLPQPRQPDPSLSEVMERLRRSMAHRERRTAALIEAAVRRGDARPLDSRRAAAFLWSAWMGALTLGHHAERAAPGDDRELRAVLEAGLRIVIGGVASDEARKEQPAVRALLESAPGPSSGSEPRPEALRRAPVLGALRTDLPELALWTVELAARPGPSPAPVRRRLETLGDRAAAAEAEGARRESTPWAYRVLLRQLGVDPAGAYGLTEQMALRPGDVGQLESSGLPLDALLVATIETGVPLVAMDAAGLEGELALRRARAGELLGADGAALPEGCVVIADERRPVAVLFGRTAGAVEVSGKSERLALAAIQAKGVPDLSVEEALWTAIEIMREAG
jgi:AcrR family transcriptional regulator/DNA/RNA-binding domain of Phe-tRNA-synthetase-like protein